MGSCQLGHTADGGVSAAEALDELTQLTALTKLVVSNCKVDGPVPPGVWTLTQLCHLDVSSSWEQQQLPEHITCLKQLTYLGLSGTGLQELPADLGTWLPQLVECVMMWHQGDSDPAHLTRLTSLNASCCQSAA
jgi:Leucine-rich repeat (LRR) protein